MSAFPDDAKDEVSAHEPTALRSPGSLRILIVEDDEDTAQSMSMLLRLNGYDVYVASDGTKGLDAALATEPDVIILDIGMPRMNGWELARWLRRRKPESRPMLIAVTGYGQHADRVRSAEAGIDLHLVKPVDLEELDGLLQKYLSLKRG